MWEMSADKVVSPCAPWAVTEFAQGTAFIGKQTLVPTQDFPLWGACRSLKLLKDARVCVLVTQLCPTLSDPMDCAAFQAPPSMGFSRQEYWSGVPLPSPILALTFFQRNESSTIII